MATGEQEKIVSVAKGQILIGTMGLSKIERKDSRQDVYDFLTWAKALNIKAETPLIQVARVVAGDSFRIMNSALSQRLRDGTYSPPNDNPSHRLVGYYIGKCDAKGCSAASIDITIDWNKRLLNPPEIKVVSPNKNSPFSFSFSSIGGGIIDRFLEENSPTRQTYLQSYPKEVGPVFRNQVLGPEVLDKHTIYPKPHLSPPTVRIHPSVPRAVEVRREFANIPHGLLDTGWRSATPT